MLSACLENMIIVEKYLIIPMTERIDKMKKSKDAFAPVFFNDVKINQGLIYERMRAHKSRTIPICVENCESSGRINNFKKAAGRMEGEFVGKYYDDSDVYKVIEGIAYTLMLEKDDVLEAKADEWIDIICDAQQDDGYLVCYFIMGVNNLPRWSDMEKHEDYCLGHMIEAAVAYKKATGKSKFLNTAQKFADHFYDVTIGSNKHWVCGHQELELALVKLFEETKNEKYLNFAEFLIEERGRGYGVGDHIWKNPKWGPKYAQDDKVVGEMTDIAGHAVRAMYLYCGMCDVAYYKNKPEYLKALDKLWNSTVLRNMYITGGIGSSHHNEGFSEDYDLPNDTAYCETCASVGMAYWNHRMNMLTGEGKFADIVEKEIYGGILSGVSLNGDKFFYVNPLETDGNHHRVEWYGTSCCPTQISRFIPSIAGYIYAKSAGEIVVNQYISSQTIFNFENDEMKLTQSTSYPWDEKITIVLDMINPIEAIISLRIPSWCKEYNLFINGKKEEICFEEQGYLKISKYWHNGDIIELVLKMPIKLNCSHPKVKANEGKLAVTRGPVVYCVEEVDNMDINKIRLSYDENFTFEYKPDLLKGVVEIKSSAATFVPYFAWDNRKEGQMKVWVDEYSQ